MQIQVGNIIRPGKIFPMNKSNVVTSGLALSVDADPGGEHHSTWEDFPYE